MEFWIWFAMIVAICLIGQRGIVLAATSSLLAGVLLPSLPALFVAAWLGLGVLLIWG